MLHATQPSKTSDVIEMRSLDRARVTNRKTAWPDVGERERLARRKQVLVVCSDAPIVGGIAELRVDDSLEVFEVERGDARAMIERQSWDVVAIDVGLARANELGLVGWIHAYDPRISVLALGSDASVEAVVRAIRSGACDYLAAPLEECALLIAVRSALEDRKLAADTSRRAAGSRPRSTLDVIAESVSMRRVVALADRVGDSPTTVLITGPSGAGKEVIARTIHRVSSRRDRPFVAINCAAIPENLLESELFGYRRGAFTGAVSDKRGLFQEASGGTLLLDEVGDLPPSLQAKLLRVLQEREVRPVGATQSEAVDVRVIAATHRDLTQEIARGAFREDLYYRLCVVELAIPGLSKRTEDILPLAEHFLRRTNEQLGRRVGGFAGITKKLLRAYAWPGNARELENEVERAVLLCDGSTVLPEHLPESLHRPAECDFLDRALAEHWTIEDLQSAYAKRVLALNAGNKKRSARQLGIDRRTLQRWLAQPIIAEESAPQSRTFVDPVGQK